MAQTIPSITELLAQGKVPQARKAIAALPKQDPQRAALLSRVNDLDLRKAQRQAKVKDFVPLAGPEQQLALARMQGQQALSALANSDHPDAPRAAVATAADATALRKALRRLPGPAELGLGFAALMAGDLQRAEQAFQAAAPVDARRAQLGLALCAVRGDTPLTALTILDELQALPGSVFPATAKLRKTLQRHNGRGDTPPLRELLISGSSDELRQALNSWPKEDHQGRGWLALRLGDRYWAQGCNDDGHFTQLDAWHQVNQNWEQAAKLNPSLLADVSKRLLCLASTTPQALTQACKHWWQLYLQDPQLASRIVEAAANDLPPNILSFWLAEFATQVPKKMRNNTPPCMLLLNVRLEHTDARLYGEQMDAATWKEDCATLDQAYGEQALWLDLKLSILQHRGNIPELRKCCVAVLRNQPQRIGDLLPLYLFAAYRDRRAHKQIAREIIELLRLAPQDPHLLLLACDRDIPHSPPSDPQVGQLITALAKRDEAELLPWASHPWGQHASVDLLRLTVCRRFTPPQRKPWLKKDALSIIHPHLCALDNTQLGGCMPFLRQWQEAKNQDWRPIYHLLRALRDGWNDKQDPDKIHLLVHAWEIFNHLPQSRDENDPHQQRLAAWVDELDIPDGFTPTPSSIPIQPAQIPSNTSKDPKSAPPTKASSSPDWREWVKELATQPTVQGLFGSLDHAAQVFVFLHHHFVSIMELRQPSPLHDSTDTQITQAALGVLQAFRDRYHRRCDLAQLSALELTIARWQRQLPGGHIP